MIAGTLLAALAGLFLGLFQLTHRMAHEVLDDRRIRLSILLAVAVLVVAVVVFASEARTSVASIPARSLLFFSLSGLIHFFLGFLLMSHSQSRVGAGRTGVLIGTIPVYSAVFGFTIFGERLAPVVIVGIAVVIAGVIMVSRSRISGAAHPPKRDFLFGLGTALCYATSPIFVRFGLRSYDYPTIAVGVGMAAALLASVIAVLIRKDRPERGSVVTITGKGFSVTALAGVFIAVATLVRYVALTMSPLAVVTTMSRISIPLLLFLSPLVFQSRAEKASGGTWAGAALIIAGSIAIGFFG